LDLVGHGTPPSGHPSPLPNFKIETDLLVVASQFDMSEQVPAGNGDVFFFWDVMHICKDSTLYLFQLCGRHWVM